MKILKSKIDVNENLCGQCGACVAVCQFEALYLSPLAIEIDDDLCTSCGDCVRFCPVGALNLA